MMCTREIERNKGICPLYTMTKVALLVIAKNYKQPECSWTDK